LDYVVCHRFLQIGCDVKHLFFAALAQINIEVSLAVTCFDECEDKKSQILKTTESGFGGG